MKKRENSRIKLVAPTPTTPTVIGPDGFAAGKKKIRTDFVFKNPRETP